MTLIKKKTIYNNQLYLGKLMLIADIREHLTPNFTALYDEFIVLCGENRAAALLLSHLFGWSEWADNHRPKKQGWIIKTAQDFFNDLKMKRQAYEKARAFLLELGVIQYKRAGVFGKMAYRIVREKLFELIYTKVRGMSQPEFNSAFRADKDGYHIPKFIPLDLWHDFLKMRESKSKKPLGAEQKKHLIKQLTDLHAQKFDVSHIMKKSLISGWAGFYRPDKSPYHAPVQAANSSLDDYKAHIKQKQQEIKQPKPSFVSKEVGQQNTENLLNLLNKKTK